MLATMRRLGVARIRLYMAWAEVAPPTRPAGSAAGDPAAYAAGRWAFYDRVLREARARGIGIDLTIGAPPPAWAAGPRAPAGGPYPQWRPSAKAFGQFISAVGRRYSGTYVPPGSGGPLPRVSFWAIWNEPNYGPELAPQAVDHSAVEVSPALYRGLLDAAWRSLQATGHGQDTILIGELAPRGITVGDNPGNFSGMVPLRFLRALYCAGPDGRRLRGAAALSRGCPATSAGFRRSHPSLFEASGLAVHPYPQGTAPDLVTPGEPDYADLPHLPALEQTLDSLQALYGSERRLPIFVTEYGYKTDPPDVRGGAVSPSQAAAYLNWAEYLAWRDPRVRSWDQYQLTDPPPSSGSEFATGLEFADGSPKPGFAAFRLPIYLPRTQGARGAPLEVWGCLRPVRYWPHRTSPPRIRVEFQALGARRFATLRTVAIRDRDGYFDTEVHFPRSGVVRLSASTPGGGEFFSRAVTLALK